MSSQPPTVVEVADDVREKLEELGPAAEAAVAELCRTLERNPHLGSYDTFTTLYRTTVVADDGTELLALYLYGPPHGQEGIVRIGSVSPVRAPVPARVKYGADVDEGEFADSAPVPADPRTEEIAARQVTEAWQRIAAWLAERAPASAASLRPGASEAEIAAVEGALGVPVPAALKALWRQCAGVYDVRGGEFLPGNRALMDLEWVARFYREQMRYQEQHGDEEFPVWRRSWIPVCASNAHDTALGLCLDAVTGQLWQWSRYGDQQMEVESLTVFLEEMADALEAPSLARPPKPGLVEGGLSWGPPSDPDREALWRPLTE